MDDSSLLILVDYTLTINFCLLSDSSQISDPCGNVFGTDRSREGMTLWSLFIII